MRAATSSPQITELLREFDACTERARAVVFGLAAEDLARPPRPKRWSIAEILEHLSITTRVYLPTLDGAASELRGKGLGGSGPYELDWIGTFMVWSLEPPPRFRVRAPGIFMPVEVPDPGQVLATFVDVQGDLVKRVQALDGLELDQLKIRSPAARVLRFNVWSALKILSSHQRRHMLQAENVKRTIQAQG